MTQPSLSQEQLAELAEILEIAKIAEHKAKYLCKLGDAFAQKYEKRLEQFRQAAAQKQS